MGFSDTELKFDIVVAESHSQTPQADTSSKIKKKKILHIFSFPSKSILSQLWRVNCEHVLCLSDKPPVGNISFPPLLLWQWADHLQVMAGLKICKASSLHYSRQWHPVCEVRSAAGFGCNEPLMFCTGLKKQEVNILSAFQLFYS